MPKELNMQRMEVKPNSVLSELDKAYIAIHYPRDAPAPEAPEWTLEYALNAAGVPADSVKSIMLHKGNADKVRDLFSLWNASSHAIQRDLAPKPPFGKPEKPQRDIIKPPAHDKRDWCATSRTAVAGGVPADPDGPAHAVSVVNASLWLPGDTIRYWYQQTLYQGPIVDGLFEPRTSRVDRLESVFREYEAVANIKFEEAKSEADSDVRIWFRELDQTGQDRSWCWIAKTCKDPNRKNDAAFGGNERTTFFLNLPRIDHHDPHRAKREALRNRVCRHEVGHLLGLLHEHPSRKVTATSAEWAAWDPKSVMLYPKVPTQKAGVEGKDALDAAAFEMAESNVVLSDKDKAFLQVRRPRKTFRC